MANQAAYALPADYDRALRLTVDGDYYNLSDQEDAEELDADRRYYGSRGIYFEAFDSSGVETLNLRPVPTAAGYTVALTYIFTPTELSAGSDTPAVPERFHPAIVEFARSEAFGLLEDNPELEQFYRDKFDRKLSELAALRIARSGRGPVQMRVQGIHY